MLRGNLSTRPFYNDRIVSLGIAVLAVLVLALTAFNALRIISLSGQRAETDARLAETRGEAAAVRAQTAALRMGVDQAELGGLAAAAQEANALIDRRTFSWTALLGLLEGAMPPDVRLVSVSPRVDKTVLNVSMTIVARNYMDVDAFLDALRDTGAFYDVAPSETQERDDGTYTARVDASYLPAAPAATEATAGEARP
jgi:Tfp pilus assembly protein PilN